MSGKPETVIGGFGLPDISSRGGVSRRYRLRPWMTRTSITTMAMTSRM